MSNLSLEMFVGAHRDYESSQFHILNGLQKIRHTFSQNRIYPPLAELIDLYTTLRKIAASSGDISQELPRRIKGIDLQSKRIIYETIEPGHNHFRAIEELIHWALPHIQQAIEEGETIYNFVDSNMKMEEVGILPSYVEEGYLLIPELRQSLLHVIRYEVSIFTGADQHYRNLKTTSVRTVPLSTLHFSPASIKMDLMRSHPDLPNPATYFLATDLDFPFQETMLPIAKRKLLRQVARGTR
jgi:hypothetical protein